LYAAHPELRAKPRRRALRSVPTRQRSLSDRKRNRRIVTGRDRTFAFVRDRLGPQGVHAARDRAELGRQVHRFRDHVAKPRLPLRSRARALRLILGLAYTLRGKTELIIVPTACYGTPFPGAAIERSPLRIEDMAVRMRRRSPCSREMIGVRPDTSASRTAAFGNLQLRARSLPETANEVRRLAEIYGAIEPRPDWRRCPRRSLESGGTGLSRRPLPAWCGWTTRALCMRFLLPVRNRAAKKTPARSLEIMKRALHADLVILSASRPRAAGLFPARGSGLDVAVFVADRRRRWSAMGVDSASSTALIGRVPPRIDMDGAGISKAEALQHASVEVLRRADSLSVLTGGCILAGDGR